MTAFRQEHEKIKSAQNIVIAGAGPTGVEVAGEIKDHFPEKTVTLVGSMLTSASPWMQSHVKHALEKMGVILQEGRVEATEPSNDGKVKTTKGATLDCDLLLNTAGFTFTGAALADDELKANVSSRGQFICRPTLQLQNIDTVFACGDIVQVPEGKYADIKGVTHAEKTGQSKSLRVCHYIYCI